MCQTVRGQVNAEQVTAIGRTVLSLDDYMLAIHYFNMAIKAKDYLAEPYFLRGLAKMKLDDFQGSEEDCTIALNRNKYMTEAHRLRGYVRLQLGRDSLALQDIRHCLEENPKDKEVLFYKAVAELNLKYYDDAEASLTNIIASTPDFYEAITARGQMRLERGDTAAALQDFHQTVQISKSQDYPYAMMAEIYARRQDWPKAIDAMNEVIRFYPDRPDLLINRAFMRYMNDDYYGAMNDYNETLRIDPDNEAALFNRALLRFEVMELKGAADDFSRVIKIDKNNFHAHYNRALIYVQTGQYAKAEPDLKFILAKYPRWYPAYYVLAQVAHDKGDERAAIQYMMKADDLVRKYVENPKKNPLDRPTISEKPNNKGHEKREKETEEDVLDRFNQLVTAEVKPQTVMSFNEKYKGRVQDREISVAPEPMFQLSFFAPDESLKILSNYFRELGELNSRNYISDRIYLKGEDQQMTEQEIEKAFKLVEKYSASLASGKPRAIDYIARGTAYTMLRNYDSAIIDFEKALELMPDYSVALMGKGLAADMLRKNEKKFSAAGVIEIFDKAIAQNPGLVYAWFNKGNVFYDVGDYRSAEDCFTKAIALNSELGEAYYNRGLARMQTGKRDEAFSDFSKAGELGVIQGYRVMKSIR